MPALFLGAMLAFSSCKSPDRVELTDWQFAWHNRWYPATVPSFIHTDLMASRLIPDPYYGTNEDSVQWVYDERQWVYRTVVARKSLPKGDSLWLVLEGLAGPCEVAVSDGCWQSQHFFDDMFTENVIVFHPSGGMRGGLSKSLPLGGDLEEAPLGGDLEEAPSGDSVHISVTFLPLEHNDWSRGIYLKEARYGITLPERRAFTRMAPYQPGWDWGPRLQTCGIWKPVYITNKKPEYQETQENLVCPVTLRQEVDSIGQSFTFYRDGKPIFVKGANWIPVHSFPVLDSANRARYRYLLTSAKEAGFNMLRVWGGGIYEHDYFYDLCDSLGIMVWQDFMFAGSPYPDNDEMLNNIRSEVRQQVTRIARHPCVVLWCGNNEVKNGWEDWGWQSQYNWTPEQRQRLEKAMDTIFGYSSTFGNSSTSSILAQAVRDCDPLQRPYITTSPLYGWGHPECVTHGDSHYWGVWWGEMPFEVYAGKTGRFMSEYGFQSYPMMSSIRQFCPSDQLDVGSPTLRSHQKHGRGLEIIDKAMQRYYGFDSKSLNLEDFVYVSQLLQAWGVGYGIWQHIKQQPHCMGTLYWQLNDCWPVASWSSIDYYGNWKALHYRAQALFDADADMERWAQYYALYPKDRQYPDPKYRIQQAWESDGTLVVTVKAESDIYDLYLDTEPHVDGHFTRNFVDLRAGEKLTTRLVPADPQSDVGSVRVTARTLNELYF